MKRVLHAAVCFAGLLMALATCAAAAERSTFVVLPFHIQGPAEVSYLKDAVPQMLNSRLYWKDRVVQAVADLPKDQGPVFDDGAAEKARARFKADYVVWGSVTVLEGSCSIDVRVRNKAGKMWTQSREAKTTQLVAAMRLISDSINSEVFGRVAAKKPAASQAGPERINQMNPDLVINESTPKEVYLNPQFRYSGSRSDDSSRVRSQTLPFTAVGMEVVDADGDGRNEVFVLSDTTLYAYRFGPDKLMPLGEYKFPTTQDALSIRSLDRRDGRAWLIVNLVDKDGKPVSSILTFTGNGFNEEMKNIKFFLNVVKVPPDYRPTLVGQQYQAPRMFKPGIYEMIKSGGQFTMGARLSLPPDANALNFAYLPPGRGESDSEKIIVLSDVETLRVYTPKGARLSQSDEKYSGSSKGIEIDPTIPGMGNESVTLRSMFYIPMRMIPVDLERDGNYELIVNKPISTASQIFDRYRFFPQSEIHSLYWDGIGMNLQWKTRRIKGSMADYAIADANNDDIPDLVTCINTHPGALGVMQRKTIIVLYPLDLSRTDDGTAPYQGDFYE